MEHEGSLPRSQELFTERYPASDETKKLIITQISSPEFHFDSNFFQRIFIYVVVLVQFYKRIYSSYPFHKFLSFLSR
jgi:hypothetical protein